MVHMRFILLCLICFQINAATPSSFDGMGRDFSPNRKRWTRDQSWFQSLNNTNLVGIPGRLPADDQPIYVFHKFIQATISTILPPLLERHKLTSEEMLLRQKDIQKETVRKIKSCEDSDFNLNLETFFLAFSELAELYNTCSGFNIKEDRIKSYYINQKYISACKNLAHSFHGFCVNVLIWSEDGFKLFFSDISEISYAYATDKFMPDLLRCELSRALWSEHIQQVRECLPHPLCFFTVKDLRNLRRVSVPLLATLKSAHSKIYQDSFERMMERKVFVFEQSRRGRSTLDMEYIFYAFFELEEKYNTFACDTEAVPEGQLNYMQKQYISACHNLLSVIATFCDNMPKDEFETINSEAQSEMRSFWESMDALNLHMY